MRVWRDPSAMPAGLSSPHDRIVSLDSSWRRGASFSIAMNKIDLSGRFAVITGGARGIGYAITERLLDSGA